MKKIFPKNPQFNLSVIFSLWLCLFLGACGKTWVPTGGWQGVVSPGCEALFIERQLSNSNLTSTQQMKLADDYFKRCGSELSRSAKSPLLQLVSLAGLKYDYQKRREAEAFETQALDGLRVRGTLFIKESREKRPMIIVKCGVQCDDGSPTLSHMLANFYDEGPFHVMLLPSITSASFQKDNAILPVGGYDEGRQLVRMARWVQSNEFKYSDRISEVHVVGVSLGGHSALYAALYASYMNLNDGRPVVKSVFTGCPAVDLEVSVKSLFSNKGIVGLIFKKYFWNQMTGLIRYVPILSQLLESREEERIKDIPELISRGALDYYRRATARSHFNEAPFQGKVIRDVDDLWQLNRFQEYAHLVKIPVYVWTAENDRVVLAQKNSHLLDGENADIFHRLYTAKGNHCAFSDEYSWRSAGAVMRGLILSRTSGLRDIYDGHVVPLKALSTQNTARDDWFSGDANRKQRGLQWRVQANASTVDLISYGRSRCLVNAIKKTCDTGYSVTKVAFSNVGLSRADVPKNDVEAQALTRWLNAHAWAWGAQRGVLKPTEQPQQIEFDRYGASPNETLTADVR